MSKKQKVVLIGAGNVATNLGLAMLAAGFNVVQVWSKTMASAKHLSQQLGAAPITNIKQLIDDADIYILAIKDDAIKAMVRTIKIPDRLIVHTSGSINIAVLQGVSKNYGVFYPLHTCSKTSPSSFANSTFGVEASNKRSANKLIALAKKLSATAYPIDSKKRKILHLAAVFANNFTNHMYAVATHVLAKSELPFKLIIPLIDQTVQKIKENNPMDIQTGPAMRGDITTVREHLRLLKRDYMMKELYRCVSRSIAVSKRQRDEKKL